MHDRRVRLQRVFRIDHKRQRLISDLDKLGAVFGERAGVGDHGGDPFADIARLFDGERIAPHLRRFEAVHQLIGRGGKLFAGEHIMYARQRQRGFAIDGNNARGRMRRGHQRYVEHIGRAHIGGKLARAGNETPVLAHAAIG